MIGAIFESTTHAKVIPNMWEHPPQPKPTNAQSKYRRNLRFGNTKPKRQPEEIRRTFPNKLRLPR